MKTAVAATLLAVGITAPVTAHADCGDPGQNPCTGPVPTVDQIVALLSELMDPNKPNEDKHDVVTPDFSPENVRFLDRYLDGSLIAHGDFPYDFIVTDIQPGPNNFAGATVATHANGHPTTSDRTPIVLVDQSGHWLIARKTAVDYVLQVFSHYERKYFAGI